ncbi:unnamed protein product, partial [Rotaria sp. Silwood2]
MNKFLFCSVYYNESCSNQAYYSCQNSTKCISKFRLVDGLLDCPLGDDESYNDSCSLDDYHRLKCPGTDICISATAVVYLGLNCNADNDTYFNTDYTRTELEHLFQIACNGFTKLRNTFIQGHTQNDETNCDWWPCNNSYTICDGVWNCPNGYDELNCLQSECSEHEHPCLSVVNNSAICLPISQAGNE